MADQDVLKEWLATIVICGSLFFLVLFLMSLKWVLAFQNRFQKEYEEYQE